MEKLLEITLEKCSHYTYKEYHEDMQNINIHTKNTVSLDDSDMFLEANKHAKQLPSHYKKVGQTNCLCHQKN